MNGAEHYVEAERLLVVADRDCSLNYESRTGEKKADLLAAAQVHATLALAAAQAEPWAHATNDNGALIWPEWDGAIL